MTHPHDPFVKDALDRIHEQRDDQPPDHAKHAGELVYDQRCPFCRSVTADPLPTWLAGHLDLLADQKEAQGER